MASAAEYGSLTQAGEEMRKADVPVERKWELGLQIWECGSGPPFVSPELLRAVTGEFVGTLFFLFNAITIARFAPYATEEAASTIFIATGFGLAILILVYVLAEVSGANFNPAVSFGLLLGKRISLERFIMYVIAQCVGGTLGAGIASLFMSDSSGGFNAIADDILVRDAFIGEILCTCLLVLSVFAATDGELCRKHGHVAPLLPVAIGFAVLLGNLVLIPVDGCSINPARTFATSVTNHNWDDHWVFWFGPLIGAALATVMWEAILRPAQPVKCA